MRVILLVVLLFLIAMTTVALEEEEILICPTCGTNTWLVRTPATMTVVRVEGDYLYTCSLCFSRYVDGKWYTRAEWMEEVNRTLSTLDKEDY